MEMDGKLFDELTSSYKAERQRYQFFFQVHVDEYLSKMYQLKRNET